MIVPATGERAGDHYVTFGERAVGDLLQKRVTGISAELRSIGAQEEIDTAIHVRSPLSRRLKSFKIQRRL